MRRPATLFRMASQVVRDGCIAINKPCGLSSAQVIRECQSVFSPSSFFEPLCEIERKNKSQKYAKSRKSRRPAQVKMGHGGTLDPLATGVLILGIGAATKSLPQFLNCVKTYETVVLFGASTDTYDRVGRVLAKRPYDHITKEKVLEALEDFKGKRTQVPPLYSALKMNGKPLYEYAREGKPIPREIQGREVEVHSIDLLEWYEPGKHAFRWPLEEAEASERNLAEQVWRLKKQQENSPKLTPEQKEEDDQAVAAHETFKRKFEERQDALIKDKPKKRPQNGKENAMMSGALGQLPAGLSEKGRDLVPAEDSNTPPPWSDEGPPAVKIRLTVSSGYYIRSFCHDLGTKLDSAALMSELCRTRQSDFTVGGINCLEFDDLTKGEEVWTPKVANMLARWNGEPEDQWRPPQKAEPAQADQKEPANQPAKLSEGDEKEPVDQTAAVPEQVRYHRPNPPEKRKRSPSAEPGKSSPPRKSTKSERDRDDDEASWNGIQD